jgi:primosomal protein N'
MKDGKASPTAYLVEVMPLSKAARQVAISYFSSQKIAPGTIVKVPLKNALISAIVLGSKSAVSAKAEIRRAGFALRKIAKKDIFEAGLSSEFLKAVKNTARYYAASSGTMLAALLPKILLEEPEIFFKTPEGKRKIVPELKENFLLQMETEERFGQYRALVRQAFARNTSVMFVVPTHLDAVKAVKLLSQGIDPYVHIFTLQEKKDTAKKTWQTASTSEHPVLFITTPAGLSFERKDLGTYIIERENSRAWRTLTRPYIHYRVFFENLARETDRQLILGDSVLSLETLWKEKNEEYGETSLIRWRLPASATTLVDASAKADEKGKFRIFSPELKRLVKKSLDEREPVFLFGTRKGLAPTTVCGDCGLLLPCLNCGAPVVLHRGSRLSTNTYVCHACNTKRDSTTTCGHCGGWNLVPLGIGVERIAQEAHELFPHTPIEILDKDHAPTDRQAKSIIKRFEEKGGILIGTELALFYLEKVPYAALVSADSLFSIPDFGINDRIFYLVSRLREMTQREAIIQTRNIGKQILAWATQGNIIDFYLSEISEREALSYPPFSIFVKITALSSRPLQDIEGIKEHFLKWSPDHFKDSLILRIPRASWPETELVRELSLLGREFSIKVDPESIL